MSAKKGRALKSPKVSNTQKNKNKSQLMDDSISEASTITTLHEVNDISSSENTLNIRRNKRMRHSTVEKFMLEEKLAKKTKIESTPDDHNSDIVLKTETSIISDISNRNNRSNLKDVDLTRSVRADEQLKLEANIESEIHNELTLSPNSDSKDSELVISIAKKQRKSTKSKGLSEEELRARREKQILYLNKFASISLKYSEFLEQKIFRSQLGDCLSREVTPDTSPEKEKTRQEIVESLKYFLGELRSYQVEGVTWLTVLFENSVNGILADDMGLGKTIQIIALFCYLYEQKADGPYLIVAPLSTLSNWQTEFEKFAPKIPVVLLHGDPLERRRAVKTVDNKKFRIDGKSVQPVVICNYEVILSELPFFERYTWQYIVVDEGHKIKNADTKLSRELRALKSINRTLLTGTPLQNNIKELWSLFNFLMPDLFKDIEAFSTLLELEDMKDTNRLLAKESQTKVISTIHKVLAPFMLRREKHLVLTDLVPKKEVIIHCFLTEWQEYLYRAILQQDYLKLSMAPPVTERLDEKNRLMRSCKKPNQSYRDTTNLDDIDSFVHPRYNTIFNNTTTNRLVTKIDHIPVTIPKCAYKCYIKMQHIVTMLKMATSHPYLIWAPIDPKSKKEDSLYISEDLVKSSGKLLALDVLLPKFKAEKHKVLIFSTMVMMLDMIEEMLILRKHQYRRLDGQVNFLNRKNAIRDFSEDPEVFVFLLSTRAGGLGLNLTAADTVIFVDRDWNPMADLQAQDRCHRIGQNKPVMVYSLISKGTIDEVILNCGDMKRRLEKIVLQEGKYSSIKKQRENDELKELEQLLNNKDAKVTVRTNGLIYTQKELNQILDRTELYEELERQKLENKAAKNFQK